MLFSSWHAIKTARSIYHIATDICDISLSVLNVSVICAQKIQKYLRKFRTLMTLYGSYLKFAYNVIHDIIMRTQNFIFTTISMFGKLSILRYHILFVNKPYFLTYQNKIKVVGTH